MITLDQKSDATNIDQKSDATNSNDNLVSDVGAYPLTGKAPEYRTSEVSKFSIQELIPLENDRFYTYFNAVQDWQKANIDKKINSYRELMCQYVLSRHHYTLGTDFLQLPLDEFKRKIGLQQVYGDNRREYFVKVVETIQPQYQIINQGTNLNGKVSLVKSEYEIRTLVKLKDAEELLVAMYGNIDITDPKLVDITPIDIKSLKAYIKGNENYRIQNDTIRKNREQAEQILLIAELTDGVFPQIIKESPYGRRYYTGQSLQNMSKIARSAALGDHYQYDLNAAVYAIKLNLCGYMTDKKFTYTGEYIEGGAKYKDSIRKRIAKTVFQPDFDVEEWQVEVIKKVITAIGFGASTHTKGYYDDAGIWQSTSIADLLSYTSKTTGNQVLAKDKYDRLLSDPWLKNFMAEQKEMTDIITKWYIENDMVNKTDHAFLVDGRNAFNKNKLMAYIFQSFERMIMDTTHEFITNEGIEVLLRVHDAIYTRKKIDMAELHTLLKDKFQTEATAWLGNKLISFSEEQASRFQYHDYNDSEYKEFVRQEENMARGYKSILEDTELPVISKDRQMIDKLVHMSDKEPEYSYSHDEFFFDENT